MKTTVFVNLITADSNLRIAEIDDVEIKYGDAFFTEAQWAAIKQAEQAHTRNCKGYSIRYRIPGCIPSIQVHYPHQTHK